MEETSCQEGRGRGCVDVGRFTFVLIVRVFRAVVGRAFALPLSGSRGDSVALLRAKVVGCGKISVPISYPQSIHQ